MKRATALGIAFATAVRAPAGAQPAKLYRVGVLLGATTAVVQADIDALVRTLSGSGYQRGKNLEIIIRNVAGDETRAPLMAAELVRAKPDALVSDGGRSNITALKHATMSIPIVVVGAVDPVGAGFVASLARPGGNVTGISSMDLALTGKRLQLLEEIVPHLRRVAVIRDPRSPGNMAFWRVAQSTARKLGIALVAVDLHSSEQAAGVTAALARSHADGVLVLNNAITFQNSAEIGDAIQSVRLPAMYLISEFAANGGLISYGSSQPALWSQAATYVARILKGAKPADLPVQQPTTFDLVVNLKTAKTLGLTVPQSILLQATQVIR